MEKEEAYKQEIKDAKIEIRKALAERGMSLRERRSDRDRRKVLTAYPEYNQDPLSIIVGFSRDRKRQTVGR